MTSSEKVTSKQNEYVATDDDEVLFKMYNKLVNVMGFLYDMKTNVQKEWIIAERELIQAGKQPPVFNQAPVLPLPAVENSNYYESVIDRQTFINYNIVSEIAYIQAKRDLCRSLLAVPNLQAGEIHKLDFPRSKTIYLDE